jgi:hypothetical protein
MSPDARPSAIRTGPVKRLNCPLVKPVSNREKVIFGISGAIAHRVFGFDLVEPIDGFKEPEKKSNTPRSARRIVLAHVILKVSEDLRVGFDDLHHFSLPSGFE